MTDPKPLPCPFCGAEPVHQMQDSGYYIDCSCNAAPSIWKMDRSAAIEAWNRRAPKEDV